MPATLITTRAMPTSVRTAVISLTRSGVRPGSGRTDPRNQRFSESQCMRSYDDGSLST